MKSFLIFWCLILICSSFLIIQTYSNPYHVKPALSPTSVEFYYQGGDLNLLAGTFIQIEANFNDLSFFAPCPAQANFEKLANLSYSFPPPPTTMPCPCGPCTPILLPEHATSAQACACDPDSSVICLAPNSFNFSAEILANQVQFYRVFVPLSQEHATSSLAVFLHFTQGDGTFVLHFGDSTWRNFSSSHVGDEWIILCRQQLLDAVLVVIDIYPLHHFSVELIKFQLSVFVDQPLLPLELFAPVAPIAPSLVCTDAAPIGPTVIPLRVLPSVEDGAMYLAGWKTQAFGVNFGGYNITVALSKRLIPTRLNLFFQYSSRGKNLSLPWPYYNIPSLPWVSVPITPVITEDLPEISFEGCYLSLGHPLFDGRGNVTISDVHLPLVSRMKDCRFQEMSLEVFGSESPCTNYACYFATIVSDLISLESFHPRPPINTLLYWTREKLFYRRILSLMLISSKPFHTCRLSFWNDFIDKISIPITFEDDHCHIWDHTSAEWQADPCCNPYLDQLCLPRNTTAMQASWISNASALETNCPSTCLSSFIDPVLQAFPIPSNCNLSPILLLAFENLTDSSYNDEFLRICLSKYFGASCATDQDCQVGVQFCHPFAGICVWPCESDSDCAETLPLGTNTSYCHPDSHACFIRIDDISPDIVHQHLSDCLFAGLSYTARLTSISPLDWYQEQDKYKLLSLLLPEDIEGPITPELVEKNADQITFPVGCYGPGPDFLNHDDCLEIPVCNWSPDVICTQLLGDCQTACELPPSRPSPYLCEKCHLGPSGAICQEVSRWAGCYSDSMPWTTCNNFLQIGAVWDQYATECFLPAAAPSECPPEFQWRESMLSTEEECFSPDLARCSDVRCSSNCTQAMCENEYGRCIFLDNATLDLVTQPGFCVIRPLLYAQTGAVCPEYSYPTYIGCFVYLPTVEQCEQRLGVWLNLTESALCTDITYCPDSGLMGFFISDESCRAAGREPMPAFQWQPARWVSANSIYRWTPREYSTRHKKWVQRLNVPAFSQLTRTSNILPISRALQLQISCYYARHFPLFSLTGCGCFSTFNSSISPQAWDQKLVDSGSCFEVGQFPIVMQTVPVCSGVQMKENWIFPSLQTTAQLNQIGFVIDHTTPPILAPELNRLCVDIGFVGRMVASEATLISRANVESYGRAISYDLGSSDPLYRAYNLKHVRVGVLSGNGIATLTDVDLKFVRPLEVCLTTLKNLSTDADSRFTYLTGCRQDESVHRDTFTITEQSRLFGDNLSTVCFPIDEENTFFPCSIIPGSEKKSYFESLTLDAQAALLTCVLGYGLAFMGSLALFAYVFPLRKPSLSTSILVILISSTFLLLRLLFFVLVMNGKLTTGQVLEVFLSLAPTVIFFSLLSVLLAKWLTLGFIAPKARSRATLRRLPPFFLVPILLVNIILYLLLLIVIIATGVIGDPESPVCSSKKAGYNWIYYFVFAYRILLAIFAIIMFVGCSLAAHKIYRVLKNALPSRVAIRKLWLFFALIACALFSLVGQTVLLLLFFIAPESITLVLAVTTSLLIELLPVVALLVLLLVARRSKIPSGRQKRTLFDLCYGQKERQPYLEGNEVGLLDDNDTISDDRELLEGSTTFTTREDWSVG